LFAVVRLRGSVGVRREIKDTLGMMRLHRVNHCVVIKDTPENRGMLQKVKDYVAFGEIEAEDLALLLKNRGRLTGNIRLTDEYVSKHTSFKSIEEFAKAVVEGKANLTDLPELKPVFRLHPPRKGHRGIKRHYGYGGELGYHGKEISGLLNKMR